MNRTVSIRVPKSQQRATMDSESIEGIRLRTMKVEDYPEVKIILGKHFYPEEPLCMCSGQNMQKFLEKEQDAYHMSLIEQGTSIVAFDENNNNRIVGLVLAGAQVPKDLEDHREIGENYGPIFSFTSKVETKANLFELYGVSKALYSHITNVDASMRGKGLGTRLAKALMEVGREKGFPLLTAYCTSFYSARQKEAMGMKCEYSLAYADYKNDQGEVVFKPPPPHKQIRVLAYRL